MPIRSLRTLAYAALLASIALLAAAVNARGDAGEMPEPVRVAVLGDSLAAGYGLEAGDSFPSQLERALNGRGENVRVLNHGVSGDTSAGGLRRVAWMLGDDPRVVVVELGANDALRGLDPGQLEANLEAILLALGEAGVVPVLAGMRAPRNLGPEYAERFDAVYPRLAKRHGVALYPFFLAGVAGVKELNQPDGIHPNPRGAARIVKGILPTVQGALHRARPQ